MGFKKKYYKKTRKRHTKRGGSTIEATCIITEYKSKAKSVKCEIYNKNKINIAVENEQNILDDTNERIDDAIDKAGQIQHSLKEHPDAFFNIEKAQKQAINIQKQASIIQKQSMSSQASVEILSKLKKADINLRKVEQTLIDAQRFANKVLTNNNLEAVN